jgi:hypothetical protein
LQTIEDPPTTIISTTTTTATLPMSTTIATDDDDDDNVIWEDPDLDFVLVEPTTTTILPIGSTSFPFPTELPDDTDDLYESSTIPLPSIEHFDFLDGIPASSTIAGGMAVAQQDSQFNWWDLDEASLPPLTEPNSFPLTTIATNTFPLIPSTTKLTPIDEDEWAIFNTSSITDSNSEIDFDMNDYFTFPALSTTPPIDLIKNNTPSFIPHYFTDSQTKEQLLGLIKPVPTLAMPPFSWMLHFANQNKSVLQSRQSVINKTRTTNILKTKNKKKRVMELKAKRNNNFDHFYEYCDKKQCLNGGRLNSECLCICLPAFNGNNCEKGTDIYISFLINLLERVMFSFSSTL